MRFGLLALSLSVAVAGTAVDTLAQGPFREEGGLIIMEFENTDFSGTDWELRTQRGGWHGDGYLRWEGPDLFFEAGRGLIEFPIRVTNPGEYNVKMYSQHNGEAADADNDVWVKLASEGDGAWRKLFSNQGPGQIGIWDWDSRYDFSHNNQPQATLTFPAGDHVIQFSGRSNGMMIDRLHLFLDGVDDALDLSRPESPRDLRGHDFTSSEPHGFVPVSGPPLAAPQFNQDARGLVMGGTPSSETIFGFWTGPIPDVELTAGDLWEVTFWVTSSAAASERDQVPGFRLRLNNSAFQVGTMTHIESSGNGHPMPVSGETKEYKITYHANHDVPGQRLNASFDYLYIPQTNDIPNISLILEKVEARKLN